MDYRDRIRRAIDYLESRLRGEADFADAARAACYSIYHFSRVFALVVGESPGTYLRRRRLAEAASRLRCSGDRLLDVALDFGFGSHEAFSRAFKEEFGVTPNAFKRGMDGSPPRRPALEDPPFLRGGNVDYRIESMGARLVAGFPCYGEPGTNGVFGEMWDLFNEKLENHSWHSGEPGIGIEFYSGDCTDMKKWFYLAGSFARSVEEVPPHLAIKHVPASEWFAFRHVGPLSTLGATYREAYGNAIPESGYEPWLPIDFELYGKEFRGVNDPSSVTEIWIPVRKKK